MADDLARRLVQSPHWRWMPGMLARTVDPRPLDATIRIYDSRWILDDEHRDSQMGVHHGGNRWPVSMHGLYVPDLSDPATEGCLLRLAREAWAPRGGRVHVGPSSVAVYGHGRDPQWWDGPTGAALAHAILAAGEVRDA